MVVIGVLVGVILVFAFAVRRAVKKEQAREAAKQEQAEAIFVARKRRSDLGTKRPRKVKNEVVGEVAGPVSSGDYNTFGSTDNQRNSREESVLSLPAVMGFPTESLSRDDSTGYSEPALPPSTSPSFEGAFQGGESGGAGASGAWDAGDSSANTPDAGSSDSSVSGDSGSASGGDSGGSWSD